MGDTSPADRGKAASREGMLGVVVMPAEREERLLCKFECLSVPSVNLATV